MLAPRISFCFSINQIAFEGTAKVSDVTLHEALLQLEFLSQRMEPNQLLGFSQTNL